MKKGGSGSRKNKSSNICAHHITGKDAELTCFDKQALIRIAESLNDKKGTQLIKIQGRSKEDLWKQIQKVMQKKCGNDEVCWAKNTGQRSLIKEHFKPVRPKGGRYAWLSSLDIEDIMRQYEKKYKDFIFFGPLPSDFDKIITELKGQELKRLCTKGIKRIGIVLNTDPHNRPGQHWVAFFFDLTGPKASIEYYDPLGKPPFKSINEYMKNLSIYLYMKMNKEAIRKINKEPHQRKDGQCGVFSTAYIVKRLNGKSFEDIMVDNIMTDGGRADCRDYYFRD